MMLKLSPSFEQTKQAADTLVGACHAAAYNSGWWHDLHTGEPLNVNVGEKLMLIVSELAEAMEGHRKNLKDTHLVDRPMIEAELADVIIRTADLCGGLGLDLGGAVAAKLAYNATRADHQVENRRTAGGKAY